MGLRLTTNLTEDQRHDEWARIIRRIAEEHVGQAWSNYMFRLLRAVFNVNRRLAQSGGFLGNWIVGNYVDSTLMHLRRELDRQDGTECLLQLLLDMLDHPTVVTRTRFVASWPANTRDWLADETFSKYAGSSSAGHIDPAMIRADLARLEEAEALRVHAERTRAHRTPEQGIDDRGMTFEELHRALVTVREVVGKYREVLGVGTMTQWQPVPQFNPIEPFLHPWVEDPDQVKRLSEEDRPRTSS
jgi:hypothetical protein